MNEAIKKLNEFSPGWSQGSTLFINTMSHHIIDFAPGVGTWFYITDHGGEEGFASFQDAVDAYIDFHNMLDEQ